MAIRTLALVLTLAGPGAAQEHAPPDEVAVLAALDELRERDSYFGMMHGWPCTALLTLLDAREVATPRLLEELESLEADVAAGLPPRPEYRDVLFYVLGQVKDPRGIEWLEARLDGSPAFAEQLGGWWLNSWRRFSHGPSAAEHWWLRGQQRWGVFLRRLAAERVEGLDRSLVLEALDYWFDDDETRRFFEQQRSSEALAPEEVLVVEGFFARRGLAVDGARLADALAVLAPFGEVDSPRSSKLLFVTTQKYSHEAFVPWLVELAADPDEGPSRVTLREMCFRLDYPEEGWPAWWRGHRGVTYEGLREAAFDELERRFESSPDEAAAHLGKLKYGLVLEPVLIRRLTRLARYPEAHDTLRTLVRWHEGALWHDELRALADAIEEAAGGEPVHLLLSQERVDEPRFWLDDLPYSKGF